MINDSVMSWDEAVDEKIECTNDTAANTRLRQALQSHAEPNSEFSTWKIQSLKQLGATECPRSQKIDCCSRSERLELLLIYLV